MTPAPTIETKHTPGPWVVFIPLDCSSADICGPTSWKRPEAKLAHITSLSRYAPHLDGFRDEQEANARLIAAAPDLLEALKDCLLRFTEAFPASSEYEPIKLGFAAIAKAEGRQS